MSMRHKSGAQASVSKGPMVGSGVGYTGWMPYIQAGLLSFRVVSPSWAQWENIFVYPVECAQDQFREKDWGGTPFIYLFIYCHLYSAFSIVQCSNALYRL